MPTIRPNLDSGGAEKRTTFRPPWVKDGPCPLPCPPTNPWLQQAKQEKNEAANAVPPNTLRKPVEKEVKINIKTENENEARKPKEREVQIKIEGGKPHTANTSKSKGKSQEIKSDLSKDVPQKKPENTKGKEHSGKKVEFKTEPEERKIPTLPPPHPAQMPAPPPPPPPMAPPPPPPPLKDAKPISKEKAAKLDSLRSRPRRRPDWVDMMKEVEQGIKLKHVACNDRSAPVLPKTKAKGQFVYESEKHNSHNLLLKEIQQGVHLKKVKTNDRSKPILEGLRKFRRQMTIEEIITKSASVADVVAVASEPDELDDIDKVRDDLQSTKQMLALELRNKEALERENKRLLARLANLEAELEKEKQARSVQTQGTVNKSTRTEEDDKLISKLKEEAAQSTAMTKEMEDKYHKTAEELDLTRAKLESAWLKNSQLEMELKSKGKYHQPPLTKQLSTKKINQSDKRNQSSAAINKELDDSDTVTESESEGESEEEEIESSTATQEEREMKLLNNKLKTLREKKTAAYNEKKNLKSQLSKLQHVLKDEKKKYKLLQKEVEKMASIMKDVEGDEESDEIEDDEEEDEEETETESESEEEESEEEIPANASHNDKVRIFNSRIRNLETLLTRAKKGNYLLKANIERKQDDVNRQKEMSLALQEDLNAVLSELG